MSDNDSEPKSDNTRRSDRTLSPAAQRALSEAEARRKKLKAVSELPQEKGGRKGPEPTRFGDWEKNGLTSDF